MEEHLVTILPVATMIDDFFVFGFIGGMFSYLYYRFLFKNDPTNHVNWVASVYGTFLAGSVGGLLAIVFDRSIALAVLVGFLHQVIYLSFLKSAKNGTFLKVLKEVLIRYLTGGKLP